MKSVMQRAMRATVVSLAVLGAATLVAVIGFLYQGTSADVEPGATESAIARSVRHTVIPASARGRRNPEPATAANLRSGLEHFADHCATCHANDGSGTTSIGRRLSPRVPDMRLRATQNLSDGELFYIIEHGVRLTGMPGWGDGTPEGERASWHLVHFIRHLPHLTEDELESMRALNPKTADLWREEEAERRFLSGDTAAPPSSKATTATHKHGG
jgi:mono/diheme cytochrome c family protein